MSTNTTASARRGTRGIQISLALLALLAAMFVGTQPASAAGTISLLDSLLMAIDGDEVVDDESVHVEGSGFPASDEETTYYAFVAVCNYTAGGFFGTHCDGTTGAWDSVAVDENGDFSALITIDSTFANFDFSDNQPLGTVTICNDLGSGNGDCEVQVSVYDSNPPSGPPVEIALVAITF